MIGPWGVERAAVASATLFRGERRNCWTGCDGGVSILVWLVGAAFKGSGDARAGAESVAPGPSAVAPSGSLRLGSLIEGTWVTSLVVGVVASSE